MLDISLVGEILCLMPEEELNKNLLLWASKSLTVISHWAPSSGLNNTKYDLIKFSLLSQCNSKNGPEFELGIPTPVLDLHNNQASNLKWAQLNVLCILKLTLKNTKIQSLSSFYFIMTIFGFRVRLLSHLSESRNVHISFININFYWMKNHY